MADVRHTECSFIIPFECVCNVPFQLVKNVKNVVVTNEKRTTSSTFCCCCCFPNPTCAPHTHTERETHISTTATSTTTSTVFLFSFLSFSDSLMKFIQTLHEANKMLNLVYKFKQVQIIIWVPVLLHRVPHNFKIYLRFFCYWFQICSFSTVWPKNRLALIITKSLTPAPHHSHKILFGLKICVLCLAQCWLLIFSLYFRTKNNLCRLPIRRSDNKIEMFDFVIQFIEQTSRFEWRL